MTDILMIKDRKSLTRTEASSRVDEFNLSSIVNGSSAEKRPAVADLVDALESVKDVGRLKQQLSSAQKRASTLQAPVHRAARERVQRAVAYSEAKKKVTFWDEIVRQNRLADNLQFPLKRYDRLQEDDAVAEGTLSGVCRRFAPRTELEVECEKLLKCSKNTLPPDEEYTEVEKEALRAMSVEEAQKRRDELCKVRALISYKTAENRRKRAIKSKRFHRMAKKGQRKSLEKEVAELMRNNDTHAASEKLKLLEMDRIAERSTLKHRGTGKWAKHIRQWAKKDPKLRDALQSQLRLGKELAEKVFAARRGDGEKSDKDDDSSADDDESRDTEDHSTKGARSSSSLVKLDLAPKVATIHSTNQNCDDVTVGGSVAMDSESQDQFALIAEAFADDDVGEQEIARAMRMSSECDDSPLTQQQLSDSMPGWNSWVGPGLLQRQRCKLKRKLAHLAKSANLAKSGKKVTINEKCNESVRQFQVKQTPFPYSKTRLFEESLAQPLGREWNTSTSYSMLIKPPVRTKLGHVIEPINVNNIRADQKVDEDFGIKFHEDQNGDFD